MLQHEIYSLLLLNKTAQRNSQHCTKLHDEVHNVLHDKIYLKIAFSLCFVFFVQAKNTLYPQSSVQTTSEETSLTC